MLLCGLWWKNFKNLSAYGITTWFSPVFPVHSTSPLVVHIFLRVSLASRVNDSYMWNILRISEKVRLLYTTLLILWLFFFSSNRSTMPTDYFKIDSPWQMRNVCAENLLINGAELKLQNSSRFFALGIILQFYKYSYHSKRRDHLFPQFPFEIKL